MYTKGKINLNKISLLLILLLAGALRFYKSGQAPFTVDEYSALFRTQYSNFKDLINFGVVGDGHPAGIQLFLYYLTKVFGFNEFWIKFPFIIFGILSVLYTFKIGKLWFNETVGLLSATFIACLQFPVLYSLIARPYISGLFFCLFMIYYWSQYIFFSHKKNNIFLAGFVFGAILCAYNHYFSLLMAIITGFAGLFFIDKKKIKPYVLSGVVIFIFFIPHLGITLSIFKLQGLSWLGKPDLFFFTDYIKFIFHSSIIIGLLITSILLISYFNRNKDPEKKKFRIIAFVLFILPFFIGFTYSIFVKSVIQFSVLIFSFPFLIILLISWIKELSPKSNLLITGLTALVICTSLIVEKKHYKTFYQSGFSEILKENSKVLQDYDPKEVSSIIFSSKNITNYLLKNDTTLYNFEVRNSFISNLDQQDFYLFKFGWSNCDSIQRFGENATIEEYKVFLESQKTNYLYFGWAHNFDSKILGIIKNYYPFLISHKNLYNSEIYLFSKVNPKDQIKIDNLFECCNSFEQETPLWSPCNNLTDSISFNGNYSCFISENTEYSSTFKTSFNSVLNNNSECINVSVNFYSPDSVCNALLVFSIETKNKNSEWYSVNLNDYIDFKQKWQTANLIVQIDKVHFTYNKTVKVYIWNLNHESFFIDNFSIKISPGNKNRYSY